VALLVLTAVHVSWGVYWMVTVMERTVLSLVACLRHKKMGAFFDTCKHALHVGIIVRVSCDTFKAC